MARPFPNLELNVICLIFYTGKHLKSILFICVEFVFFSTSNILCHDCQENDKLKEEGTGYHESHGMIHKLSVTSEGKRPHQFSCLISACS